MHKYLEALVGILGFFSLDVQKTFLLFSVRTNMLVKYTELTGIKLGKELANVL